MSAAIILRRVGLSALFGLLLLNSLQLFAVENEHIIGTSVNFEWQIDVTGSKGVFTADGKTWNIEYFQTTPGLNGFAHLLSFLGREEENFSRIDVFVNSVGQEFLVYYYDYKENILISDHFEGDYRINRLEDGPTVLQNYIPKGRVPDYEGQDFILKSEFADVTAQSGTVRFEDLNLKVYPLYNVVISPSWSEFWTIGIDPATGRTYFLIFYRTQSSWLVDLWTGEVRVLPLGEAEVVSEYVYIERDFLLEDQID